MGYSACESSLQSLLAQIDVDHDLSISFNEFVRFVRKVCMYV
jgi:Ca2+-binding EF-hand superfamily protein